MIVCGTRPWTERILPEAIHVATMAALDHALTMMPESTVWVLHWHWKIPAAWLRRGRFVGFHASDLPRFRGGAPIRNQQRRGMCDTKLTAFQLDEGLDTGPIVLQRDLDLRGTEDDVLERIEALVPGMIAEMCAGICLPHPQTGPASRYTRADA